jgi:uncharacterized protein YkwD
VILLTLLTALASPSAGSPSAGWQPLELEAMNRINYARLHGFNCATKSYGAAALPALTPHLKLRAAARGHAADMQMRGYFAHDTPDGITVKDRVTKSGYAWSRASENILGGERLGSSARNAVKWWLESPVHCRNITNPAFKHFAAGHVFVPTDPAGIQHYWVLVFASPI